ncbi:histone deacetylase HDT2-like [Lotus japonicus]|uniref:histone deacetylase HDT2-like n=1 Tax=Lotus japonicus TaxID=34305 RepID=UPI00258B2CD8|nr:histone deacetylase HDT2-like [Lotus japonicus]XP_057427071.1 histone deacetylase HDT2-like [Lotus japonicus]
MVLNRSSHMSHGTQESCSNPHSSELPFQGENLVRLISECDEQQQDVSCGDDALQEQVPVQQEQVPVRQGEKGSVDEEEGSDDDSDEGSDDDSDEGSGEDSDEGSGDEEEESGDDEDIGDEQPLCDTIPILINGMEDRAEQNYPSRPKPEKTDQKISNGSSWVG